MTGPDDRGDHLGRLEQQMSEAIAALREVDVEDVPPDALDRINRLEQQTRDAAAGLQRLQTEISTRPDRRRRDG